MTNVKYQLELTYYQKKFFTPKLPIEKKYKDIK